MKRFFKYIAILLGAMFLALPCGYFYAHRKLKDMAGGLQLLAQTSALGEYETLVDIQYRNADYVHAKSAILNLVDFMTQMQERQQIVDHRAFAHDEGVAFMRLALLEEKAGNRENSQRFIQQAQDVLKREYHKDYSEDFLRKFVANADSAPEI